MNNKDVEYIDVLLKRLNDLPDVLDLRIRVKWEEISQAEKDLLYNTYKDLDDILNDLLAFLNVRFSERTDFMLHWNNIDFDPKIGNFKIETNSRELIKANWLNGMHALEALLKNIRGELILKENNSSKNEFEIKQASASNQNGGKEKKQYRDSMLAAIGVLISVFSILFGDNLIGRLWIPTTSDNIVDSISQTANFADTKFELPYLESVPILDKGLYIKYYFNDLIVGGPNIDDIRFSLRKKNGEKLEIIDTKDGLVSDINSEPYIEIEYKGKYYSIEIAGKHYSFNCAINRISKPTLQLIKL